MSNGKTMIIHVIVSLVKKILLYKMSHFAEPVYSKNNTKVELDLSNYVTKFELKNTAGVDTSNFAKGSDLATVIFIIFWDSLMFLPNFLFNKSVMKRDY